MQSQITCRGCRTTLLYGRGASSVRCAVCYTITPVLPQGTDMAQLECGACHTMLLYASGATSVRCSCCNTVNLVRSANQLAYVTCGRCRRTLMYPFGAPSVQCAVCHYVTNIVTNYGGSQITSASLPNSKSQTVIVENPASIDESGKPVISC
ncbi:Protein LOL2 [Apostasia shenzhenica]|uniref:Protein LOL2 n=1 Tax=Apostasia shenzhenica TaxID=1088818 RepID=A0A2I0B8C9_9ASPA|nr:Protein LOL2 [Apostasia shenzhenica]